MRAQCFTYCSPNSGLRNPLMVVWVPEAQLQFQWVRPNGAVQMTPTDHPLPPDGFGELVPDGERFLPYTLIKEARRYLRDRKHQKAQEELLKNTRDRIAEAAIRSEGRLQAAAGKFLRDRPPAENKRAK